MTITALLLVLASAFLHAGWSAAIKDSRDPLTFNLLQLVTPIAVLAALLPWLDFGEIPPTAWKLLAATSFAHGGYFYWMSRAYEHGDLTLVYPICRSTPAFLPLVAVPLLGESISPAGALGIAIVVARHVVRAGRPGLRLVLPRESRRALRLPDPGRHRRLLALRQGRDGVPGRGAVVQPGSPRRLLQPRPGPG